MKSPSKRPKLGHGDKSESQASGSKSATKMADMYSFPRTSNIIDLTATSSPQGSAQRPKATRIGSLRPQRGTRKLTVINLRQTSNFDPEAYYKKTWEQLEGALEIIFAQESHRFSKELMYRGVEYLCRMGKSEPLFKALKRQCSKHVSVQIKERLAEYAKGASAADVLAAVTEAWTTWQKQLTTIRSIFFYLDRSYLLHKPDLPQIHELGRDLFRDHVFLYPEIKSKVLSGACMLVGADRARSSEKDEDPKPVREATAMFHGLCVYTTHFEPTLLDKSEQYFSNWASSNASRLTLGHYVEATKALFDRETHRCETFALDKSTKRLLIAGIEDKAIAGQQEKLTGAKEFGGLMRPYQFDTFRDLYALLKRKGLGDKLRTAFTENIKAIGASIVFDEERVNDMVPRLLHFKKQLDTMWASCFEKKLVLGYGLKEAFEEFINKTKKTSLTWNTDNDKPGEMIAKYLDAIMRGGVKAIPQNPDEDRGDTAEDADLDENEVDEDEQMNQQLDRVLELFRFVNGKATFEAFYKTHLAKRLLMNRSASADMEKSMLTKLKAECGANFTQNLEQMFKDVELSKEDNASYKTRLVERGEQQPVDLSVNILSSASWPSYREVEIEIPTAVQQAARLFEANYLSKHSGRKLDWKHSEAHCLLRADFSRGRKELIVSAYQAVVLLAFNECAAGDAATLSYADLQAATKLVDAELQRTLQSLACARYRVLTKTPRGKDVSRTDTFTFNAGFADPKYRIKINQIQLKETKEENKATHERVAADRRFETQAAVVRIMKGSKSMKHAQLVAAVIDATKSRGSIDPDDIKKQIEKWVIP